MVRDQFLTVLADSVPGEMIYVVSDTTLYGVTSRNMLMLF